MILVTRSVDETRSLGEEIARRVLRAGDFVVLDGELGAGKTALAQGVAKGLGVHGRVTSPTFVIAREHEGAVPLTHVDAYRLAGPADLVDLGFDDLVRPDGVTLVEWGERVVAALPEDRLEVRIRQSFPTVGPAPVPVPSGEAAPGAATGEVAPDEGERTFELVGVGAGWSDRTDDLEALVSRWREEQEPRC